MKLHLPIALLAAVLSTVAYGAGYDYSISADGSITGTYIGTSLSNSGIFGVQDTDNSTAKDVNVTIGAVDGSQTSLAGIAMVGDRDTYASGNKNLTIQGKNTNVYVVYGSNVYSNPNSISIVPQVKADEYGNYPSITINVKAGASVGQIQGGHSGPSELLNDYFAYRDDVNKDGSPTYPEYYGKTLENAPWALNEKVIINVDNSQIGVGMNPTKNAAILGVGYSGFSSNNSVEINITGDSTIHSFVVGGASGMTHGANGDVLAYSGSINISMVGGEMKGDFYVAGDGRDGSVTVRGNSEISLSGASVEKSVYAGGIGNVTVRGNTKVVLVGDGTVVQGDIYGASQDGGKVLGDRILSFDGTSDAAIDGYMAKAHGFNAVELKNKGDVNFDTDRYANFDSLYIADGNAGHTTVTSEVGRNFNRISIGKGGELSLGNGATYTVTGTEWGTYINDLGKTVRPEGAEEAIIVNGALTVKGGAQLNMVGSGNQMMVGNGTLTVDNQSTVNLSTAQTLSMGYNAGESGTILVDNGSTLNGGSQNTWLGGGTVTVDHGSTMTACIGTGTSNNYRLLMGLGGNTTKLEVKNGSTFTSGASRMVTNYQTGTNVEITVDNATFTQLGTAKVSDTKTEDSITYICDRGINNYGNPIIDKEKYPDGLVSNVSTTFTAKNGGKIDIQSSKTYIGNAKDKDLGYTDKSATFNVGKDSSISFQQLEVYAETKISFDDASGVFSATGVNLYDGAIMNIEKAGSVSLGDVVVGGGASLNVSGTTLVFTETADITVATGGSLTLDNVAFELVLNDATGNDFSSLVGFEYDVLKGLTEDAALSFVDSLNKGTIDVTIKGLVDGELVALNAGELSFSNVDGTVSIKGSASIPEPTTATLSLLALAALAARRRRR